MNKTENKENKLLQLSLWEDNNTSNEVNNQPEDKFFHFKEMIYNYFEFNYNKLSSNINYEFMNKNQKIKFLLNNKYEKITHILGIDENLNIKNNEDTINDNVIAKYKIHIKNELKIVKIEDKYHVSFKDVIHYDNSKAEFIEKILLPKVKDLVSFSLTINDYIDLKNKRDSDYKILKKFANKHKLSEEVVYLTLIQSPELIKQYNGYEALLKNKDVITNKVIHFQKLLVNNYSLLDETVKIIKSIKDDIKELDIKDEYKNKIIENINNMVVYKKSLVDKYNFLEIENNITNLNKNKDFKTALKNKI